MTHPSVSVIPEGRLAYGIQLPVQALSLLTSMPWEREAGPAELLRAAQAADAAGFFYVAVCDHVAIPRDKAETMSTTWFNPVATLGWLAGQTEQARLMTNVYVVAYRRPLETAKAFATLDHLSGGRVILGVGAGHVEGEFAALGVPFANRGALTDAAVDEIVAAWTDEFVGDVGLRPRPAQRPRPPIWVGGSSKPALRRVAARGDGWIPQGTPRKLMPESIAFLHAERDRVRPGASIEVGVITEHVYVGEPGWDVPRYALTGSAERIAESLNEYGAMGVSHLQLRFASRSIDELCDQMTAFGDEVGPLLARGEG
ncbi:MAG: TIGR03619 family F420-dependent LLM class oxidoreductase [Actinobacteria bacterium]|nr:TIGR03619 family F420-dependent LLM class oxidoreductase [Actinomycetota bacterium]